MDDFGVLVERYGVKTRGNSAPLANLKAKTKPANGLGFDSGQNSSRKSEPYKNGSFGDDLDGFFQFGNISGPQNYDNSDIFGEQFRSLSTDNSNQNRVDLDTFFTGSTHQNGDNRSNSNWSDDFNFFGSETMPNDSVDDLFGNFASVPRKTAVPNVQGYDDLIPGFGGSSPSNNNSEKPRTSQSQQSRDHTYKQSSAFSDDPFSVFESTSHVQNSSSMSFFDSLGTHANVKMTKDHAKDKSGNTSMDNMFDSLFNNNRGTEEKRNSSGTPSTGKGKSPLNNFVDDFSTSLFGEFSSSFEEFREIEGESEERRRARLNHHTRTKERMAKALAEKNKRDLQTQQEQEERGRLSEALDEEIKRWAAGKEGNLRALLSSLQYVLWPECGWQAVSLTDLITSTSVKKVYHKATLCVHPDKVQQKRANLREKYIAEKVFDILKEAFMKFNAEELR